MRYVEIPGLGRPVARAVLGTEGYILSDYAFRGRILDAYLCGGGNAIDTARLYAMRGRGWPNGCGEAELLLGRWMARGNRDRVVLITKGGAPTSARSRPGAND